MTPSEIQSRLEGEEGDDAQFQAMKFVIKLQIDRAFGMIKVRAGNNIQLRQTLYGPSVNYNQRGNSDALRAD